jgi:phenylacetate-CoA ligase
MDAARNRRVLAGLEEFFDRPPSPSPSSADPVDLFRRVAETVPAYRDFLRRHGVSPGDVTSLSDFRRLPLVTKENYLTRYPLAELCRTGRLEDCDIVAVSSGSTGRPTYWPRSFLDEVHLTARFEQIFHDGFRADERTTLAVVCFPLGTWVGGLYTTACCRNLAAKGYPITVVAPGNDREEILRVVPELAPSFDQVVLLGYPPFLKDVVDTGRGRGTDWPSMNVKLVLAGEVFSEDWRALMSERAGIRRPLHDSAALYGTADSGVLGTETPLSVCVRRFLASDPAAASALFGESRLPTLVQYDPGSRFFETHEGTLLFSADGGVPLVRYHIADEGGTVTYERMLGFCREHGFDPLQHLEGERGVHELPFVYVFGRSHFTVSYFGANIFPENVTVGLEQPDVSPWTTGKFVLEIAEDADQDRHLRVTVELAPGEDATSAREESAAVSIRTHLRRLNSEFAHYVPGERQTPQVVLRPAGDPEYFPRGVKHRYTRR